MKMRKVKKQEDNLLLKEYFDVTIEGDEVRIKGQLIIPQELVKYTILGFHKNTGRPVMLGKAMHKAKKGDYVKVII
jgi:hypothetical protein